MTSVTPRVPSPDLAEGLSERTLANIRLIIGSRLRDEDLRVIKQFRDNSMQMMGHDSDITRICRQQQQLFWERTWHKHLQTLRRDLPKTINEILDGLEKEFEDRKVPTPPALEHEQHDSTPLTPQSASKERSREELPMPEPVAKPAGLSVAPMAPMTPMEGVVLEDGNESIRSFTMPITSPVESPSKRPLDHAESSKSANKRTKSAEQDNDRLLTLDELKEFECIFRYPGHEGFYVLRCERDRCRKSCGQDMIWFDSDPFRWQRAMAHFSIYGHGVKDEAKAFQKYAWRVIDATEERNLKSPTAHRAAPSPESRHGGGPTSPPKSAPTGRDKGMDGVGLINEFVRTTMAKNSVSGGTSRSSSSSTISSSAAPSTLPTRPVPVPVPTTPGRKSPEKPQPQQQRLDDLFSKQQQGKTMPTTSAVAAATPKPAASHGNSNSNRNSKKNNNNKSGPVPPASGASFVICDADDDWDDSYREEGEIIEEDEDEGLPPLEEVITPRTLRQRKELSYEDVPLSSNEFVV